MWQHLATFGNIPAFILLALYLVLYKSHGMGVLAQTHEKIEQNIKVNSKNTIKNISTFSFAEVFSELTDSKLSIKKSWNERTYT